MYIYRRVPVFLVTTSWGHLPVTFFFHSFLMFFTIFRPPTWSVLPGRSARSAPPAPAPPALLSPRARPSARPFARPSARPSACARRSGGVLRGASLVFSLSLYNKKTWKHYNFLKIVYFGFEPICPMQNNTLYMKIEVWPDFPQDSRFLYDFCRCW